MSDNLPEAVIAEILYKLPTKCLLKCTSVCKSWYFVIKSCNFISTHLIKTLSSNKTPQFLIHNRCFLPEPEVEYSPEAEVPYFSECEFQYSLHFDNKEFKQYMPLHFPFKQFRVAGSCNGLVCLVCGTHSGSVNELSQLILWNPSIGKFLNLPKPNFMHDYSKNYYGFDDGLFGFGFDSRTHDYRVLRIMTSQTTSNIAPEIKAELYSLNADCWEDITQITPKYYWIEDELSVPAFVNGALHFFVIPQIEGNNSAKSLIVAFDVKDKVFREIVLPECLSIQHASYLSYLSLKVYKKSSIAIVCTDLNNQQYQSIWLMKEYGVIGSWVKLAMVGGIPRVLGFRDDGEILVQFSHGPIVSSQNVETELIKNLVTLSGCPAYHAVYAHSYLESLALLDRGNVLCKVNEDTRFPTDTTGQSEVKQAKTCNCVLQDLESMGHSF
ncbi:hypothetical protein JCGZ_00675 [Jatropha curcas]|uniref:F-box domain-containing protein n=1 Tax=Jatropha curcas TaxID=180498 RepID=A0A067KVA4_JATCU|nr:hypothetical protein JCGZ_00675 [Jatropha curcas]